MDRRERNHKWYESFDSRTMMFTVETEDGEIEVPAMYEVCGTCEGKGSHVNPAIDSNGLTAEDFDREPDFYEDYVGGMYDMPCNECHGNRVSPTLDERRMSPELFAQVQQIIQDHYDYETTCWYERKMGC